MGENKQMDFVDLLKVSWPLMAVGGGWVISVERRLSSLGNLDKKVDKMDEKLDRLVEHLLND